ncbi:MAG TPA: ABC transporter ATP-binding protein [Firmicutes bacterium]|nr:ABC transporter ATP-binding protein [Candidatus Fermentithermobacillaceae bacterium]
MIVLEDVNVTYPGRPAIQALRSVNLKIRPGVTLVKGRSGAGKSTLLRVLATLIIPDSGKVGYPWDDAWSWDRRSLRARIGYVPEKGVAGISLTVEDSLHYLAGTRALPPGTVQIPRLVRRWQLDAFKHEKLDRLSAGEMRRWLLAQSQLVEPDLWILDEPCKDLDISGLSILKAELMEYSWKSRHGEWRYAIASSHDDRLDDVADTVIYLEQGSPSVILCSSAPR